MPCRGVLNSGNYGHFSGYHGGGMLLMMVFGLLILLAIVFIIFKLLKQNSSPNFSKQNSSALNILDERLAKGEINEEEYNKVKAMLKK